MLTRKGPAVHLVNLIPCSATLTAPSIPLAQAILTRSSLPIETVALAVCILDSLDSRFARSWRAVCPLGEDDTPPSPSYFPETGTTDTRQGHVRTYSQPHIDSVRPELIVIAALVIAVKFLEDPQEPAGYYTGCWGFGAWTCEQLNATERCIMENLDYRIMPLYNDDVLTDAMVDMQLAGRMHDRTGRENRMHTPESMTEETRSTVLGAGNQFTPADTPVAEHENPIYVTS